MAVTPEEVWEYLLKVGEEIRELRESVRELREHSRETDRRLKETDQQIRKLSGLFTTQWGKLMEALVEPGSVNLFRQRGINVRYTARRIEVEDEKGRKIAEYDLVLVNEEELVVIEVKTTVKKEDVDGFLEKLERVREHLGSLARGRKRIYGAVAGLTYEEGVDRYAYRQGLFVLKSEGGLIRIANDPAFRPRTW